MSYPKSLARRLRKVRAEDEKVPVEPPAQLTYAVPQFTFRFGYSRHVRLEMILYVDDDHIHIDHVISQLQVTDTGHEEFVRNAVAAYREMHISIQTFEQDIIRTLGQEIWRQNLQTVARWTRFMHDNLRRYVPLTPFRIDSEYYSSPYILHMEMSLMGHVMKPYIQLAITIDRKMKTVLRLHPQVRLDYVLEQFVSKSSMRRDPTTTVHGIDLFPSREEIISALWYDEDPDIEDMEDDNLATFGYSLHDVYRVLSERFADILVSLYNHNIAQKFYDRRAFDDNVLSVLSTSMFPSNIHELAQHLPSDFFTEWVWDMDIVCPIDADTAERIQINHILNKYVLYLLRLANSDLRRLTSYVYPHGGNHHFDQSDDEIMSWKDVRSWGYFPHIFPDAFESSGNGTHLDPSTQSLCEKAVSTIPKKHMFDDPPGITDGIRMAIAYWTFRFSRYSVQRDRIRMVSVCEMRRKLRRWRIRFEYTLIFAKIYEAVCLRYGGRLMLRIAQTYGVYDDRDTEPVDVYGGWRETVFRIAFHSGSMAAGHAGACINECAPRTQQH